MSGANFWIENSIPYKRVQNKQDLSSYYNLDLEQAGAVSIITECREVVRRFSLNNTYNISDIVWDRPNPLLPAMDTISLPNHLLDLGFEDFEPQAFHVHVDAMDDDEAEDFWESYQPSGGAMDAFVQEWENEIKRVLENKFGAKVISLGSYEPNTAQVSA